MKAIILLLFFFLTYQKEVKKDTICYDRVNISSEYDYYINTPDYFTQNKISLYYYIGTELDILPCDIFYCFRGIKDSCKNISIYHEEKKGNFNAFFFKVEKQYGEEINVDFNITNVKDENSFIIGTIYEEFNKYIVRLDNILEPKTIQIYKNKPLYILFNAQYGRYFSFKMTVPSYKVFKKVFSFCYGSYKDVNELYILDEHTFGKESNIIYDNETYELYPSENPIQHINKEFKSAYMIYESLIDDNITIQFMNVTNLPYVHSTNFPDKIGALLFTNFMYEKLVYVFDCANYYLDLFYFTINSKTGQFKYYYSNGFDNKDDTSYSIELKNATCKTVNYYDYCEMNRTSLDQKLFYFMIQGQKTLYNYVNFRSTFFDESNYTIHEPYLSYDFQIDKEHPNFPMLIGNFPYNEKFYFELEINFPDNNTSNDNNINKIDIYVKVENKNVNSYKEFPLENKEINLINKFFTQTKSYFIYEAINKIFHSGVKSLFFFINPKIRYPNCLVKYRTLKQKPVIYETNKISLNEEKIFNNTYDIFFLSMDLSKERWESNDNLYIIFEGKKDAFISNTVNYRYGSKNDDISLYANYSLCNSEIKENEENKTIKCLISKKSNMPLNFVLYLNKNFEIKVRSEIVYIGNFVDILSCVSNKKYIISNNATSDNNYYIFTSSNNDFNLDGLSYNAIDSLEDFSESIPINKSKTVKSFIDKRIYVNIINEENKKFIGFKTEKITIPFKIIRTKIDESNTYFIDHSYKYKLNLTKNETLLFVTNFGPKYGNINLTIKSNISLKYFNNITYFSNLAEFQSFSSIKTMDKFDENVYRLFYGENKTIIYKTINIYNKDNNIYGMQIEPEIDGEIELEILNNFNEINQIVLTDDIPYNLRNGINLIDTHLNRYVEYFYILKYWNYVPLDNIEIYESYQNDFYSKKIEIFNYSSSDIKKDENYTYQFLNFKYRPYLIVFYNNYSAITLRQSRRKENDIVKYYDFNEKKIEIINTTKIVLISGIEINDIYRDNYYFKYTLDSKHYDDLHTKWYLDDEQDLDNIVDFFERGESNIKPARYIKYNDKIDIYLETYNLRSSGNKSAVFMFEYYPYSNISLSIDLSLSNKLLYDTINLVEKQNKTYEINNTLFFIDLTMDEFNENNNSYILFEIKGNTSAFNSTQIYIKINSYDQIENFYDYNCNKTNKNNEITLTCNYTKSYEKNVLFMLILNEGNYINIRNIVPEKKENPDDGNEEISALNYFYYIGIPAIIIIMVIVIMIIIIKVRRKDKNIDESMQNLTGELSELKD